MSVFNFRIQGLSLKLAPKEKFGDVMHFNASVPINILMTILHKNSLMQQSRYTTTSPIFSTYRSFFCLKMVCILTTDWHIKRYFIQTFLNRVSGCWKRVRNNLSSIMMRRGKHFSWEYSHSHLNTLLLNIALLTDEGHESLLLVAGDVLPPGAPSRRLLLLTITNRAPTRSCNVSCLMYSS